MQFSDKLIEYSGDIPQVIREALGEIIQYYDIPAPKVLLIEDGFIVTPLMVNVEIPTMGTVGDIDIRMKEPILIRFSLNHYPDYAPIVLSDRPDFPKNRLSHLYATYKNDPAKLCLVRGNLNEWFASRRLENFLDVIAEWFSKAANGTLNEDGDEFDPLRLDRYRGYHSYRYARLKEIIEDKITFLPGHTFSCMVTVSYAHKNDGEDAFSFKTEMPVQAANIGPVLESFKIAMRKLKTEGQVIPEIAILVWHPENKVCHTYETELPHTYNSLIAYFLKYHIDIDIILQTLKQNKFISNRRTPIIHAIRRPKKMIGFEGSYEFINFLVNLVFDKKGGIQDTCQVWNQDHIEPFSSNLAHILTGENRNNSTLFIGAGSLGSKIIMHDARSGNSSIGVCDDDIFLQHNLVRHSLFPEEVGNNKAVAIIDKIKLMFETELGRSLIAFPFPISLLPRKIFYMYNTIVDTTASQNVQNHLAQKVIPDNLTVSRCELVDHGKIGLLYIEGKNRNPRLDDLVNLAYFRSLNSRSLARWRKSDAGKEADTLNIGLGCSSISTVMADDVLSQHAAVFSRLLFNEKDRLNIGENGLLFINELSITGIPQTATKFEIVSPFDVYFCKAGSGWQVRMIKRVTERLLTQCRRFKPKETGGVLIGICNYKTKTIHVFDIIQSPSDSKGTTTSFIRGVADLSQKIDTIKERTGGLIGYVGEWHTHPMQLETMSERDKLTVEELRNINRKVPIPTLSLIITNTDLLPFIFQ